MKPLKKYIIASLFFALSFALFPATVQAEDDLTTLTNGQQIVAEENLPTTSLVIEAQHGQILWEENADLTIDPGYLTHLMTLYLTYEALQKEEITWKSTITATETHQTLSQIQYVPNNNIFAGATYSLEDLIKLVSLPTSTTASYLLAELVAGDIDAFVVKMNDMAQRIGMKQTTFYSPSGLTPESLQTYDTLTALVPEQSNQSTPKDLALLAFQLVNKFPELLDVTKQTDVVVQGSLVTQENFYNRNPFLFGQPNAIKGANGLLMDYSNLQQTNAIFTVKQNDMTVISLLIGANEEATLESTTSPMTIAGEALINHTFDTYEYRVIANKGEQVINRTTFYLENDFGSVLPKTTDAILETKEGRLYLTNSLPLISDSLPEVAVPYSKQTTTIEEKVKNSGFVSFIMSAFEITKLTILALGTIVIGFLFFLMSFFIPKKTNVGENDPNEGNEIEESPQDLNAFESIPLVSEHNDDLNEEEDTEETLELDEDEIELGPIEVIDEATVEEEEIFQSRSDRHQTSETKPFKWPFRRVTFYGGLALMIAGVISLVVQYFM